jgi:cytoskeletal protein CcmA (bactofilin family)
MFKNWGSDEENVKTDNNLKADHNKNDFAKDINKNINNKTIDKEIISKRSNTILKGSKLTGDINVTCDLELGGDVEGNITSKQDCNIVIKGTCKGNIETKGGNVDIEGELLSGNINTDGNVSITGKFKGGYVKAKGKIYINCEFKGKLESNEIEIGSNAQVKGELFYKEYISISKGAKVDVQLCRIQEELKVENKSPEKKVVHMNPPVKELSKGI